MSFGHDKLSICDKNLIFNHSEWVIKEQSRNRKFYALLLHRLLSIDLTEMIGLSLCS